MSIKKIFCCFIFGLTLASCAEPDPTMANLKPDSGNLTKNVVESCTSDFGSCQSRALVKAAEYHEEVGIQISAIFQDNTALSFNLESGHDIYQLAGPIRLNDTRTERSKHPWAVRVITLPNGDEILWSSVGDNIAVSFPADDFIKIKYDIAMIANLNPELEMMRFKGEIVAPITVRCATEVGKGTGTGRLDADFSSEFCSQYKKTNHVFESKPGRRID